MYYIAAAAATNITATGYPQRRTLFDAAPLPGPDGGVGGGLGFNSGGFAMDAGGMTAVAGGAGGEAVGVGAGGCDLAIGGRAGETLGAKVGPSLEDGGRAVLVGDAAGGIPGDRAAAEEANEAKRKAKRKVERGIVDGWKKVR
ncbi:hypothetical protein SDJN03_18042, partial [Cucurbita argyrosperma subsp. sororia]